MKKSSLVPISINLLYEGMVVPHDIYNFSLTRLLITQGNTLNKAQIEMIRNMNRGENTIYVSNETQILMRRHSVPCEVTNREALEKDTGYAEVKYETLNMLEKIAQTNKVSQKALSSVSNELSNTVEVTKPAVILDLVNALAPVDEYLQRHCVNVSLLNGLLGKWMCLSKETVDMLVLAGLLHDCGKALMPHKVLSAPRSLTIIEFEAIKMHPVHSYDLLADFPEAVRMAARGHHEKVNGSGYPDGLSGELISFMARATAVSDIYDAMVSRRSYKTAQSPFYILSQLVELRDSDLDSRLVDIFTQNMPKELLGKPVLLSNGAVGVISSVDPNDLEYPFVETGGRVIKTDKDISCVSMYFEGES